MKADYFTFASLAGLLSLVTLVGFSSSTREDQSRAEAGIDSLVSTRMPIAASVHDSPVMFQQVGDDRPANELTMEGLIDLAEEVLENLRSNVRDYTATLVKQERIDGKLGAEVRMEIKIRNPSTGPDNSKLGGRTGLAAYLKFAEPRSARGREVIWIQDQNENKLTAHEGGFKNLLRLELAPDSSLAMLGNKYPIYEIGLIRLVEQLLEKCSREVDLSRCQVEVIENQQVGDRKCRLVQVTQPKTVPGADFYIAQVFIDMERKIPLRYAAFMWPTSAGEPPLLEEEYTYLDVALNVGLSDADFDVDSPAYKFP